MLSGVAEDEGGELGEDEIDPCPSKTMEELEFELQNIKTTNSRRRQELQVFEGWLQEDTLEREKLLALEASYSVADVVTAKQSKESNAQSTRASAQSRR
jgi:hypothetical protein